MAFLTEPEAAAFLGFTTEKVKRLRLTGRLTYFRGRPVLLAKADLLAYQETLKLAAKEKAERARGKPKKLRPPEPTGAEKAAALARLKWLRKNLQKTRRPPA